MREIQASEITDAVVKLILKASYNIGEDIEAAVRRGVERETSPASRGVLEQIAESYAIARDEQIAICQDTGMAVVFADLGQDCRIAGGSFEDAVNAGVAAGYTEGFLRKSIVSDPLRRVNTEDNTPAVLHLRLVPGDRLTLTVAPQGAGSENLTTLRMLKPSASQQDVEDAIVRAVSDAGSNPCPPVIVGVGLGGSSEQCALLAKRALLRPLDESHPDPFYAEMEARLLERINRLGIGPQGLGGTQTALAVSIRTAPTHIAQLPLCVNLCCHVCRHASGVL